MGTSHPLSVTTNNHAITGAAAYADITARDADSDFNTTSTNVNKVVRVESPLSYYILTAITPTWLEFSSTSNDEWTELSDTPGAISAGLVVQGNSGGTALEFGQALDTTDSPTFLSAILSGAASNVSLDLTSTTGALRFNRLTTTQRDALTPLQGMTIFNTTTLQIEDYNGTAWVGATELDDWTDLTDTPNSISAGLIVQGNSGGTALEFGQALDTTDSPTFATPSVTRIRSGAGTELLPAYAFTSNTDRGMYDTGTSLRFADDGLDVLELIAPALALSHLTVTAGIDFDDDGEVIIGVASSQANASLNIQAFAGGTIDIGTQSTAGEIEIGRNILMRIGLFGAMGIGFGLNAVPLETDGNVLTLEAASSQSETRLSIQSPDGTGNTLRLIMNDFGINSETAEINVIGSTEMAFSTSAGEALRISSLDVNILGNLIVDGTTTSINTETVNIADNHLYINSGYATVSAQTGGLVVNYLPTATTTTVSAGAFVAGVAATSNPTVGTVGAATFSASDIVQITGTELDENDGLFEVFTHVANVLTIRGVGTTAAIEDFTNNQFIANASDSATITKVTVSVMRAGTDGAWETAAGSVTGFSFSDLIGSSGTLADDQIAVGTASNTIEGDSNFTWDGTTLTVLGLSTFDGGVRMGGAAASAAALSILSTGKQLRLEHSEFNIVDFIADSGGNLTVSPIGSKVTFMSATDAAAGFQVQKGDSTVIFNVDTSNERVSIGATLPTEKFEVFPNTDISGIIGRARIGDVGLVNFAGFTHQSLAQDGANYAVVQESAGRTILNSSAGQNLELRQGNLTQIFIEGATGNVGIGNLNNSPSEKLEVTGNIDIAGSNQLKFNAGLMTLHHGGSNAFIGNTTGNLSISSAGGISLTGAVTTSSTINNSNFNANTTTFNLFIGSGAGDAITGAQQNTAVGHKAMTVLTSGTDNVAVGTEALVAITTGSSNVAIGSFTLDTITTGVDNVGVGTSALDDLLLGRRNVAVGVGAGFSIAGAALTGENTVIGYNTGIGIVTGVQNTILGANVIGLSSTLSNNIILADGAGVIRLQFDSSGDGTIGGNLTVEGNQVSQLPSSVDQLFSTADYEDLGTASVITTSSTRSLRFHASVTSSTKHTISSQDSELQFIDPTEGNQMIYTGSTTFITAAAGGDVTSRNAALIAGISGTQLFDWVGEAVLPGIDIIEIVQSSNLAQWNLGTVGRISTGEFGPIIRFKDTNIISTTAPLILDACSLIEVTSCIFADTAQTGSGGPLFSIKSSNFKEGRAVFLTNGGELFSGESLVRVDAGLSNEYRVEVIDSIFILRSGATLFDTSGSTGTFTAVANNSISATSITGVTDSSGVASFTVASAPLLGSLATVSGFTTNTSYNTTGIVTARTATTFEIDYVAFGTTETGSYAVTGVTVTATAHGLTIGTGVTLNTTSSAQYDGGFLIYNIQTNSFDVPATFDATEAGTWSTKGLDQSDPRVRAFNNPETADSHAIACGFVNANSTATGTIVNNTFTDMVFGTSGSALTESSTTERWKQINDVNGTFEYKGLEPFDGLISFDFTVESTGGTVDFRFKWVKSTDGGSSFSDLTDSVEALVAVGSDAQSITKTFPLNMDEGDQIKPQITRNSGSSAITTTYASIYVTG